MGQVQRFGSFRAVGLFGVVRHALSGRAAPLVSRSRYTDEERRHRIGWHRGGVGGRGVHRGASLLRRLERASPAEHVRTFRSQACQRRATHPRVAAATIAVGWACRRIHRNGWPRSASGAQLACPSRHRAPRAGRGRFHRLRQPSFDARGGADIALVSIVGRLLSPSGPPVCRCRAALGVARTSGHARAVCPCGSHARVQPGT